MAFICEVCSGPSGVSEIEKMMGLMMSSYGPCECCGVMTDCIDSHSYTSLTNGRVKKEEGEDQATDKEE